MDYARRWPVTATQLRRLRKFVAGQTEAAIAIEEGVSKTAIRMSIEHAMRRARAMGGLPTEDRQWTLREMAEWAATRLSR